MQDITILYNVHIRIRKSAMSQTVLLVITRITSQPQRRVLSGCTGYVYPYVLPAGRDPDGAHTTTTRAVGNLKPNQRTFFRFFIHVYKIINTSRQFCTSRKKEVFVVYDGFRFQRSSYGWKRLVVGDMYRQSNKDRILSETFFNVIKKNPVNRQQTSVKCNKIDSL